VRLADQVSESAVWSSQWPHLYSSLPGAPNDASATTNDIGRPGSMFPPSICPSIPDVSFQCRWRNINQNYIACHDDHRNDCCPHVLVVIQNFSISLHALNVEVLYSLYSLLLILYYCTISFNSAVTRHGAPQNAEMLRLSRSFSRCAEFI
jgi:hypothetical protein